MPSTCAGSRRTRWRLARAGRLVTALVGVASLAACGGGGDGAEVRVVIPPGASFREAADSLARAGVIGSPTLFRAYAKFGGQDREVKAGTYRLERGENWGRVLDALIGGKTAVGVVTIPEGYTLSQIVPLVARTLAAPADSVEAAARDTALRRQLDVPTPTLEGYLFPSTYTFAEGTTPRAAVEAMVREFERRWQPAWNAQLEQLSMTRHDIVTLASIVEKEAQRPEERAVISAVYHNRLKRGMLLQADPTVQYARGQHAERVLYRDLTIESKYNTYRHPGLPPGPIASPGLPSIEAALFPANVPYLYFVAHPDGHHEFRTTFAEHTQAIREIRQAEQRDRRDDGARSGDSKDARGRGGEPPGRR
jgi:UPF0755 protein